MPNQTSALLSEDLGRENITEAEVNQIWESRRSRMVARRQRFEGMWRIGIGRFFDGISTGVVGPGSTQLLYDPIYEQYDTSLFSRDGLRFNQLKYPLLPAIVMRGLANEIPNKPKINFVAVGKNDQSVTIPFRNLFNQVLYEMDADQEDFEIFLDRRIFGSSIVMVMTESYEVTVNDPAHKNGEYVYEKKTKKIKQCGYKKLDLRHVFLDEHCKKTSLEDCNYAQVDEYLLKAEAVQQLKKYDEAKVKAAIEESPRDTQIYDTGFDLSNQQFVRITHCFDKIHDRYHILINGCVINKIDSPIPRIAGRKGKDIPLSMTVMYKIPGAPYGYGDSHLTTHFNTIKNLVRMMILEITQKSAKPTMAVDPLSAFDEQAFEWGQDFIRVSPNDLKEISINPNLKFLYDLDSLTDNDIIRATGIDVNDTASAGENETARKTIIRRESQNALIELMMNYMTSSFFKRTYTLLKDDIKLHYLEKMYNGEQVQVKVKDTELVRNNGGVDEAPVKGFRYFDLKEEDLDMDTDLDLEMGNIASSRELEKALAKEGIDSAAPFMEGFDINGMARYIQEQYGMPKSVLAQAQDQFEGKDPEQVAAEAINDPSLLPHSEQIKMGMEPGQPPAETGQPVNVEDQSLTQQEGVENQMQPATMPAPGMG